MTRWVGALWSIGGLGAVALAFFTVGPTVAMMLGLTTLYLAPRPARVWGDLSRVSPFAGDVGDLRTYREEHPGATIGDAIAALQKAR